MRKTSKVKRLPAARISPAPELVTAMKHMMTTNTAPACGHTAKISTTAGYRILSWGQYGCTQDIFQPDRTVIGHYMETQGQVWSNPSLQAPLQEFC